MPVLYSQKAVFSVKVTKHGMCRGLSNVWEPKPGVSLHSYICSSAPFRDIEPLLEGGRKGEGMVKEG